MAQQTGNTCEEAERTDACKELLDVIENSTYNWFLYLIIMIQAGYAKQNVLQLPRNGHITLPEKKGEWLYNQMNRQELT